MYGNTSTRKHLLVNRVVLCKQTTIRRKVPHEAIRKEHGDWLYEAVGSYETDFYENDGNQKAWAIPNVFGIVRRENK